MIWLIGNKGMLGTELVHMLERRGHCVIGTDREVDITSFEALERFSASLTVPVDWIVNCAAYTNVEKAEDDTELCTALNVEGPAKIARLAAKIKANLIHISTDYVFDGSGSRPYVETDPTVPTGMYGLTKRDGELRMLEACPSAYILRTAWLYGEFGKNFVFTMLRLMAEKEAITVVNDQRGTPTWARDLADTIATLIEKQIAGSPITPGIYHFSNMGNISWYEFATAIYEEGKRLGLLTNNCIVNPCTTAEYPAKVKRPAYSVLDKTRISTALGITIPDWKASLIRFLEIEKEKHP